MNAALHSPPAGPAEVAEALRDLVALAAGLSGSVRLIGFDEGVLAEWVDVAGAGADWDGRLLAEALHDGGVAAGAHVVALDAGAGAGRIATHLADQGWDVTGLDPSAALVDRAPRHRPGRQVAWIQADALTDNVVRLVGRPAAAVVTPADSLSRFLDSGSLVRAFSAVVPLLPPAGPALVPVLDDTARADLDAALPDRLRGHPLRQANGRQLVVWTAAAYHPPTAMLHRAALVSVPEAAGLLHHYAYRVERVWTATEVATALGAAGWTQTMARIAKADGGPADGRPYRLLGFRPPPAG